MKAREALIAASRQLERVSETARLDAELLLAFALGIDRSTLLLGHSATEVPPEFQALIARRLTHEPIAYITGTREFWSLPLRVGPGVLIPRPDSETLIEVAIAHFKAQPPQTILDLGTGPGTLLLAALSQWPDARGTGVDESGIALDYARSNAEALGLAGRATFQKGNWAKGLTGHYDLILCNPPYVETLAQLLPDVEAFEPGSALFAGADGLDDYRIIAPQLGALLAAYGAACVEIGYRQKLMAGDLFAKEGFTVTTHKDLGGRDRCLLLTR